ncbi:MAG TPA: imidazolonepropionase [Bacteroidales bacterium]|nr:imidazolonepropionase [Bacteroidales bacterium]
MKLIGPFKQLLTMSGLPPKGRLADEQLEIIEDAGILVENGTIKEVGSYAFLEEVAQQNGYEFDFVNGEYVAMPGMIDTHTHICFAGTRSMDYAMRLSGKSYLEIAASGGGIWSTVRNTREASNEMLLHLLLKRLEVLQSEGITTVEVKSGYGLSVPDELRILDIIVQADSLLTVDVEPTCLAAHMKPKDFEGSNLQYLEMLTEKLLPQVKTRGLSRRVDIFIEKSAFTPDEGLFYMKQARAMGFDITVHADQFTAGGSATAVVGEACSADHLEASGDEEIRLLANSNTVAVCLPGASMGLGMAFAPARKLLDAGAAVAIASDWNPGSAPMGDLLLQASVLGAYEHLSVAETLAAITCRAAKALHLNDRGDVRPGTLADIIAFPVNDYKEIIYRQGKIKPDHVWKKGEKIK